MAETLTLARPYAKAVFELARESQALDAWSQTLALLAALAGDARVRALFTDPRLTPPRRAELLIELAEKAGPTPDRQAANLVRLLAENRRLGLLPQIAAVFEVLRAEAERVLEVELAAAAEVDAEEQARLAAALQKKLGRKVRWRCSEDKSLIGGAVVRAADLVIDGSVRGRLARLAAALAH